jgi:hypothetical protein
MKILLKKKVKGNAAEQATGINYLPLKKFEK